MGQSKVPLYAYVDETGNTGHNLFDDAQPDFFTAALITKGNFDSNFPARVQQIADSLSVATLHAAELGIGRIETISTIFVDLLRAADARFFVSRVEKKYLLVSKLFDSIFDSGENAAVSWFHYNFRFFRLLLVFKVSVLIDEETAKSFWQCIMEPNEEKSRASLVTVCNSLLNNINNIPDQRSRDIISEGLKWAAKNPESIQIHTDKKLSRQGHFPNLVAFANLLAGLDGLAKDRKRSVAKITHDQQSEFERTLKAWHDLYSNASPEEIRWAGETYSLQKVVGSTFETATDDNSPGIQITDVVLWLYSQFRKGKSLPDGCKKIVSYALANGWESDFSFEGVERSFTEKFGRAMSAPISKEQEEEARKHINAAEAARLKSIAQYEKDKVPPFMRGMSLVADENKP